MPSISVRRFTNGLTWTLNYSTRSRTLALSFTQTDRSRQRHRRSPTSTRHFTSHAFRYAQPAAAPSSRTVGSNSRTSAGSPSSSGHEPPPPTTRAEKAKVPSEPIREYKTGLSDAPPDSAAGSEAIDWTRSFQGLSTEAFSKEAGEVLMQKLDQNDIEVKPDGILYLPEIKYRRILNKAFGPGGWGLAPRGETIVTARSVTREYALLAHGRLVSIARGEQDYFDPEGIPTATEGCKSNALMRCCKDLGVASELWDPRFIRKFLADSAKEIWVEHVVTKKRKKITIRKDDEARYPFKEVKMSSGASGAFS